MWPAGLTLPTSAPCSPCLANKHTFQLCSHFPTYYLYIPLDDYVTRIRIKWEHLFEALEPSTKTCGVSSRWLAPPAAEYQMIGQRTGEPQRRLAVVPSGSRRPSTPNWPHIHLFLFLVCSNNRKWLKSVFPSPARLPLLWPQKVDAAPNKQNKVIDFVASIQSTIRNIVREAKWTVFLALPALCYSERQTVDVVTSTR